jgi:ATP-dependent Clp protease ATP-binding subunit ClpA
VFERFTEAARQAVVLAQEEARALGHDHIDTEHLLLGCARADPACTHLLAARGAPLDAIRGTVEELVGRGDGTVGQIPFTRHAKEALEMAVRESVDRGATRLDAGGLLLGVLRAGGGAHAVLGRLGVDEEELLVALAADLAKPRLTDLVEAAWEHAAALASSDDRAPDGGDLLVALAELDPLSQTTLLLLDRNADQLRSAVLAARAADA